MFGATQKGELPYRSHSEDSLGLKVVQIESGSIGLRGTSPRNRSDHLFRLLYWEQIIPNVPHPPRELAINPLSLFKMKYTTLEAIFSASALLLSLPLTSAQTFPLAYIGCYGSIPGYSDKQTYEFQSSGHCAAQCVGQKVLYMALTAGSICYCGTSIPDSSNQVSETKCNTPCYGWGNQTCTCCKQTRVGLWNLSLSG